MFDIGFDYRQLREDFSRWWERARVPIWQWFVVAVVFAVVCLLLLLIFQIANTAHGAGVSAFNPAKPHLSLASAGSAGGGPPVIALTPDPVAGHEADWVTAIYRAIRLGLSSKNWLLLIAAACIALLQAVKHFAAPKVPFLRTDRGGVALAMVGGFLTALAAAAASRAFSVQILIEAVYYGVLYAGGYASVKKLIAPTPADRAQLVEAKAENAGTAAAEAAGSSAEAAASAINDLMGSSPPSGTTAPLGSANKGGGED